MDAILRESCVAGSLAMPAPVRPDLGEALEKERLFDEVRLMKS
jgi:hypothetical protein